MCASTFIELFSCPHFGDFPGFFNRVKAKKLTLLSSYFVKHFMFGQKSEVCFLRKLGKCHVHRFLRCLLWHCFAGGKSGGDPRACDQTPCCSAAFSRYQGARRCPDSYNTPSVVWCCMSMYVAPLCMFTVRSQTCRISWCCCMPIREVLKDVPCNAVMVPLGSSNVAESNVFDVSGQCCWFQGFGARRQKYSMSICHNAAMTIWEMSMSCR